MCSCIRVVQPERSSYPGDPHVHLADVDPQPQLPEAPDLPLDRVRGRYSSPPGARRREVPLQPRTVDRNPPLFHAYSFDGVAV